MQLIMLIVVGSLAGFIARAIMPDRQSMSLGTATLVGNIGSFAGGFLSSLLQQQPVSLLRPAASSRPPWGDDPPWDLPRDQQSTCARDGVTDSCRDARATGAVVDPPVAHGGQVLHPLED